MNKCISISVVVATRNRSTSLNRLLMCLASQINPPSFEVIICDNGSSDNTLQIIKKAQQHSKVFRYVREDKVGKSRALNTGINTARGNLIVFTDDDVQPHNDWLSHLHSASVTYQKCNIFGGRIDVDMEAVPNWIKHSFNLMGLLTSFHNFGNSDIVYPYGQYPFGPNMAIRSHILHNIESPYPENLGPGTDCPVGDETAFFLQFSPPVAKDRMYIAEAKVFHEIEYGNINFFSALSRCFTAGKGSRMLMLHGMKESSRGHIPALNLIFKRLTTCKSFRELVCISVRYIGYCQGVSQLGKKIKNIDANNCSN